MNIQFTDTIECTASHGRLAAASQIYDASRSNKTQQAINTELYNRKTGTDFTAMKSFTGDGTDEFFDFVKNLPVGTLVSIDSIMKKGLYIAGLSSRFFYDGTIFIVNSTPSKNSSGYITGLRCLTPPIDDCVGQLGNDGEYHEEQGSCAILFFYAALSEMITYTEEISDRISKLEALLNVSGTASQAEAQAAPTASLQQRLEAKDINTNLLKTLSSTTI